MASCEGCGAHVSTEFARVFADIDGVVHRCPRCSPTGHMVPREQ